MRVRLISIAASVLVMVLGVPAGSASADEADESSAAVYDVPLEYFGDMVLDTEHDRIFVSGGQGFESDVAVLGYDLEVEATLTGLPGSAAMEIVADVLYVTVPSDQEIARFDLSTDPPTEMEPIDLSGYGMVRELAYAGGRLWFGAQGCASSSLQIVGFTPEDPSTKVSLRDGDSYECAHLWSGTASPDRLIVAGDFGGELFSYDVSTSPATLLDQAADFADGDLALVPGDDFVMGSSQTNGLKRYAVEDFGTGQQTISYTGSKRLSGSVDYTPASGGRVLGAVEGWESGFDINVYRIGQAAPWKQLSLPDDTTYSLYFRGARFSEDGQHVYAFTEHNGVSIWVFNLGATCPGYEDSPLTQIVGTASSQTINGTSGPDLICGQGGSDTIYGLGGNDILLGGIGVDKLYGGGGADFLGGGEGNELQLRGGPGNDSINAGPGNDVLYGDAGADVLDGDAGGDVLLGGAGDDTIDGGSGLWVDLADYELAPGPVTVKMNTDKVTGSEGTDTLIWVEGAVGSRFADVITGDSLPNLLVGLGGNDDINGLGGGDYLLGSAGSDSLDGGLGSDTCIQGPGTGALVSCEDTTLSRMTAWRLGWNAG